MEQNDVNFIKKRLYLANIQKMRGADFLMLVISQGTTVISSSLLLHSLIYSDTMEKRTNSYPRLPGVTD